MSKKNRKNDSKALKKDSKTDIKTPENQQKDNPATKPVNVHYPPCKPSEGFDKNLIIVIICFAIIFSIVLLEKKFYKKNHKETEAQNQTYAIQIDSEPVSGSSAKKSDSKQSNIASANTEQKTQKDLNPENIEEKPFVVIVEHEHKKEAEKEQAQTGYNTASESQQISDITVEFDSDMELTKKHKSYLMEKLDTAKKLGYSNNVVIYGYDNSDQNEQENVNNSLKLANKTAEFLSKNGYIAVSIKGLGSEDMHSDLPARTVTIQLLQYR